MNVGAHLARISMCPSKENFVVMLNFQVLYNYFTFVASFFLTFIYMIHIYIYDEAGVYSADTLVT
jgi:hypothetical protein